MIDVNHIDWNEAWKRPGEEEGKKSGFVSCGKRWSDPDRCKRFSNAIKEDNWSGSYARIHSMHIQPNSRVLDVGTGPGTLAVPMAEMVHHVTAVEPSEGMLHCLRENIREKNIQNISIVPKKWEDVVIKTDLHPPYDVVVASYSLGFPDLRDGLAKMNDASSKYVYIFWFADMISPWQRNYCEIWQDLYGVSRPSGTKPNVIFNLLSQMGIYANVEVTWEENVHTYVDFEDLMADQIEGLNLITKEQEDVLRNYLKNKVEIHDTQAIMRTVAPRATIWWEKRDPDSHSL